MFNRALPKVDSLKLMCFSEITFIESDNVSRVPGHWDVFRFSHLSSKSHNSLNSSIDNEAEIEILKHTHTASIKRISKE